MRAYLLIAGLALLPAAFGALPYSYQDAGFMGQVAGSLVGAGTGAAWHDIISTNEVDSESSNLNPIVLRWTDSSLLTLPAGNATQLRVYVSSTVDGDDMILGLYTSSKSLLASNTVHFAAAGYATVSIPSTAIEAGDYIVAFDVINGAGTSKFGFKSTAGNDLHYDIGSYPPLPGTLPTGDVGTGKPCVGVYME